VLRIDREAGLVTWTLDRPEAKNALSAELLDALDEAIRSAATDRTVRAAILTGAAGTFASGGDLRELRDKNTREDATLLSDRGGRVCEGLGEAPFPVIAALPGAAIGGGAELALACDMRVADASASICFKQARMGVTTAWGSLPRLVALIGPSATKRVLFTGRELTAIEAHVMGLVDIVCDDGASVATALAWGAEVALAGREAVAETKALVRAAVGLTYLNARTLEREAFIRTWSSSEHAEAMRAYFERRGA
jgi:enoyl-CoA hydratase